MNEDPRDELPTEAEDAAAAEESRDDRPEEPVARSVEAELDALRRENADLRDRLLREIADMENLRKRTQREKEDASRFAIAGFARDVLTVGDDLRRAVEAAPAEARERPDDPAATLLAGIELTERQLLQILERHGVRRFDPEGQRFDPALHEAMFEMPDPSKPAGSVAQVVEAGYMIGERVLRPARVGVARGGPRAGAAAPRPAAGAEPVEAAPPEPEASPQPADGEPNVGARIDKTA